MITVRSATAGDRRLIWEWANDAAVRATSFHPAPIPWDDHVAWFDARIASPRFALYIVMEDGTEPVGQVRFELMPDGEAELTIGIVPAQRGRGLGAAALRETCRCFRERSRATIVAHVRPDNIASRRVFEKAGFSRRGLEQVNGYDAIRFELPA